MSTNYQGYGGGYYGGQAGEPPPQQQQQQQQQPVQHNLFGQQPQQQQQQQQQPGNMQQWQYSPQNQQQNGYGQPQQQQNAFGQQPQQQQPQQQPFWNPATTAATMAAMASMASGQGLPNEMLTNEMTNAGKFFLQSTTARFIPGLESTMIVLRSYFAVDNRYVLRKMKRVLFPFFSKQWKRNQKGVMGPDPSQVHYDLPIADDNAPDLYIPCMSLITYVLLSALCYGNAGQFNPEVILDVSTKCLLTQILEVLAIRFGFYMMQTSVPFLDLWSYTGYKYLGLCITLLVGLMGRVFSLGTTAYYGCFVWTASAASYSMLKIMSHTVPLQTAATGPKREIMVLAFALSQFATMWFVSQTKFL